MARKVAVPGAGQAKIINPWVAFLLALVTLGIYYIFWFGIRNLELNDYGESVAAENNPDAYLGWQLAMASSSA
jgi:hypothetical protein